MALARVQATGKVTGDAVTSINLTFPSPPTVGNAIVVLVSCRLTVGTTPSAADNQGNSYGVAFSRAAAPKNAAILYCPKITATGTPFTITLTQGNLCDWSASAIEVSGVGAGLIVDQTKGADTASGTAHATTATAALTVDEVFLASVLALANVAQASITVEAVSPVWTEEHEELNAGTLGGGEGDSRIVTGALGTTPSCAWTIATSTSSSAAIVAFRVQTSALLSQLPLEVLRGDQPIPSLRLSQLPLEVLRGDQPIPSLRLSQLPIEVLRGVVVTKPNVSQVVVETLSSPTPDVRDSQLAVEVLSQPSPPARLSQTTTETLLHPPSPPARITGLAIELLNIEATTAARVSQDVIEVVSLPTTPESRVSHDVVEIVSLPSPVARVTQDVIEVIAGTTAAPPSPARVSQITVEILQSEVAAQTIIGATIGGPAQVFAPTVLVGTRISQTTIEILQASLSPTRVSQVSIETLAREPYVPIPPTGTMSANYLTFTKQAGTGLQTIEGVGFRAKAVLVWSTRLNADGADNTVQQSFGMTDGLLQGCRFIRHPGGETATTSAQSERIDCIVFMTSATSGGAPTVQVKGVFGDWTDDGFTIDWSINDSAPTQFHLLAIGGEIEVAVKQVKITVNTPGTVEVNVGFQPDSFIVLGGASDEYGGGGVGYELGAPFGSIHGFGFSNGTENICSWTLGRGTAGASDVYSGLHTNRVASVRTANLAGADDLCGIEITSIEPEGFTITRRAGSTSHQPIQHILCLHGAAFSLGTFTSPATPGAMNIPLDFEAGLLIAQTHGVGTLNTTINGMGLMAGTWVMPNKQGGTWVGGTDNASPSVFGRSSYTHRLIEVRRPDTLAVVCEASVVSSVDTGIALNFTAVPATPITFIYLALGAIFSPPDIAETLFDPDEAAIVGLTWAEFTDSNATRHVWAGIALPDPLTYYGGYKAPKVIDWDPIRRGLSNIDGAYEGIVWGWLMSDADRAIRRMLANELTKWFFNRNVVGRTITDPGRRALETPRTIFRGVVREWQPMAQGLFSFAAEDYLVTTFQIGTDEQQCPKRTITTADFPTCPEENIGRPVPIIYGNLSDKDEIIHIVPGVPGTASTVGLKKPTGLTATVRGGAGSSSYTYGVTALDNRNKQYNDYAKRTDHAGETDAAYVTVTNAPSLSQMSETRYVELDWNTVVKAHHYRIYGRAVNGGTSLNLLDAARGPLAGTEERYNDGMRNGHIEVDREKTDSHPPKTNNTVVSGTPDTPESSYTTDSGRGVVPVVHVGQRIIGGTPWYEFLVCGHAIKAVTAVYQADADNEFQPSEQKVIPIDPSLETDAGVKSVAPVTALGGIRITDAECNVGGSLLVPTIGTGWAAAVGAPVYVDLNGHRYTVIYARNVIGETAALGEQPLFVNVAGIEDQGNGTGTLITSLLDQYLHVMQNWLIGNYQTGAWLPSPVFPDEALPQIDANSFAVAKAISEQRIPGGYVGAMQFGVDGQFFALRDAIAQMNVSCDVNSGFNYRTQFIVSMQSEEISSLGAAQAITQMRDIIRDTFNIESLVSEFFNRIPFQYRLPAGERHVHLLYGSQRSHVDYGQSGDALIPDPDVAIRAECVHCVRHCATVPDAVQGSAAPGDVGDGDVGAEFRTRRYRARHASRWHRPQRLRGHADSGDAAGLQPTELYGQHRRLRRGPVLFGCVHLG